MLKLYLKYLSISFLFYLILGLAFVVFLSLKNRIYLLGDSGVLHFDALLYEKIKNEGYSAEWLCAFFPGFPYMWKFSSLSASGISIFNAGLFIISASYLFFKYKITWREQLFYLSIPSLIFMFLPYSESLFFFSVLMLLIGIMDNLSLIFLSGLFLSGLIRPTAFTFIPAILLFLYFSEKSILNAIRKSIPALGVLVISLFLTLSIHYYFTGKWFVFMEAQKGWDNYLRVPDLPLTSWGGDASVRFDGSSLVIAAISLIFLFKSLLKRVKGILFIQKELTFSLVYLSLTVILILAFRGGNLFSLNRFIYATPFIMIVLHALLKDYFFRWKDVLIIFFGSEILWLLFSSYNHIHNLLMFTLVSCYLALLLLCKHSNKFIANTSLFTLIFANCYGFIVLMNRFMNGVWVA